MVKSRLLMLALLATVGATPVFSSTAAAQDRDNRATHERRYYDREHRDYHRWNSDEDRRYRDYLNEQHRQYHQFFRLNRSRQRDYWRWRHEHERDRR